jgi:hypothetical protein
MAGLSGAWELVGRPFIATVRLGGARRLAHQVEQPIRLAHVVMMRMSHGKSKLMFIPVERHV